MLQAVLKPRMDDDPAKFEEMWKSWEHQVDVYENLSAARLDDDVKISVVLREAPTKLRDDLLVSSQLFDSNYNKLRANIQAYLNSNKTWIANDSEESDPMEVDHISKGNTKGNDKGNSKGNSKGNGTSKQQRQQQRQAEAKAETDAQATAKATKNLTTTESATCAERKATSHELVGHEPTMASQ